MENKMENCENKYEKHIKIAIDYINEQRKEITEQIISEFIKNGVKTKEQFNLDFQNSTLKDGYILLQSLYHTLNNETVLEMLNSDIGLLKIENYLHRIIHYEVKNKNYLICQEIRNLVSIFLSPDTISTISDVNLHRKDSDKIPYDFKVNDIKIFTLYYYIANGDFTICYGIYKKV